MNHDMSVLVGKIPTKVIQTDYQIDMHFTDGTIATWIHDQDGREMVVVDDVTGDWEDLYNCPLLVAEERVSRDEDFASGDESNTWTFYTFRCLMGSVDVRWHGSSNGYYSESVDFRLSEAA